MKSLLFLLGILFIPEIIFASQSKVIYQKYLGNGVRIVQKENTTYLMFRGKLLYQRENNDIGGDCSEYVHSEIINMKTHTLDESKVMTELKNLSESEADDSDIYFIGMQKKYPNAFGSMILRECWEKDIFIRKYTKFWISVSMPYFSGPRAMYMINPVYSSIRLDQEGDSASIGKHGLYMLDAGTNSILFDEPQSLWLFTDDGRKIKQYTNPHKDTIISGIDLLYKGRIKLHFESYIDTFGNRILNPSQEIFSKIIPIKLK